MAEQTSDASVRSFLALLGWNLDAKKQAVDDTLKNKKRCQALIEFSKEVCRLCSRNFLCSLLTNFRSSAALALPFPKPLVRSCLIYVQSFPLKL